MYTSTCSSLVKLYTGAYGREPLQSQPYSGHQHSESTNHYREYSNPDSTTTTTTPAIYENWDLRRSDRHGSGSSGVTELAGDLATMSVDPSQSNTADPNPSKSPNPGPTSHELRGPSSNVDYQFQSPQNAVSTLLPCAYTYYFVCVFCEVFQLALMLY